MGSPLTLFLPRIRRLGVMILKVSDEMLVWLLFAMGWSFSALEILANVGRR